MRRRRQPPASGPRMPFTRWFRVERWCRCCQGSHDINIGEWARWTVRRDGTADCADCLERVYGIVRPGAEQSAAVHE